MKKIHKTTFKGSIKQYFLTFYSWKPPLAPFSPLHMSSLVFQYRIESCIWACEFLGVCTHSSERITPKPPPSTLSLQMLETFSSLKIAAP